VRENFEMESKATSIMEAAHPVVIPHAVTTTDISRGSLKWDIVGLAALNKKPGEFIESPPIKVNDLEWICKIYPKGDKSSETNEAMQRITCFFNLRSKKDAHSANAKLTVLQKGVGFFPNKRSLSTGFISWKASAGFGWRGFLETSEMHCYVADDVLSMICELEVATEEKTIVRTQEGDGHCIPLPPSNLVDNMALLLDMDKEDSFSDVTFVIDGKQFYAHRSILSVRSPVFRTMFKTNMKEKADGIVNIEDVSKAAFKQLLRFLYTGQCQLSEDNAVDMLALADRYDVGQLKLMCEDVLSKKLCLANVGQTLLLADMYHSAELKKYIISFIADHFFEVITTDGFKDLCTRSPALVAEVHDAVAAKAGTKRPLPSSPSSSSKQKKAITKRRKK